MNRDLTVARTHKYAVNRLPLPWTPSPLLQSCGPLLLTSPSGACFPLRGVDDVLKEAIMPEQVRVTFVIS